jgi:hypothetical protein
MALVGHADANRHALLNTRKRPVYSTRRLCQQTQTLNLLVVMEGGFFSAIKLEPLARGVNPNRKS